MPVWLQVKPKRCDSQVAVWGGRRQCTKGKMDEGKIQAEKKVPKQTVGKEGNLREKEVETGNLES